MATLCGGYTGKVLRVDVTRGTSTVDEIPRTDLERFLGCGGLAAKLLLDHIDPRLSAFDPANPLILATGPLAGSMLPGTSRLSITSRSPLTAILGEGSLGSDIGRELKLAGFDAVVITGRADRPSYVAIENGTARMGDARSLVGLETDAALEVVMRLVGGQRRPRVLTIGPAGERLVRLASIVGDHGHAVGRTGLGAVMGSKNLKAVTVCGTPGEYVAAERARYLELKISARAKLRASPVLQALGQGGTAESLFTGLMTQDAPIRNWSRGSDPAALALAGHMDEASPYVVRRATCYACPVACKRVVAVTSGRRRTAPGAAPEYNSLASLGTLLGNYDIEAVIQATDLCNRLGIDTISVGALLALATECLEQGLLTPADLDGEEPRFGQIEPYLHLIEKIGRRDGCGRLFADGTRAAIRQIGDEAAAFAAEVKGLDLPMHDPRSGHGLGLAYAVGNRGACHLQHLNLSIEKGGRRYQGAEFDPRGYFGPQSVGKAAMSALSENLGLSIAATPICLFLMAALEPQDIADMLTAVTGRLYTVADLTLIGERMWILKRGINNLFGVTAADDRLPEKVLTPTQEGAAAGSAPDLGLMLREYYALRRLDDAGRPTPECLANLGLDDLARRLHG